MTRPDKTLIDYLIIAISPALIMTLVGSLVFFLLDVFYRGNFAGRLEIIFALFVFAAVLVARISIEESRERAMLFAGPLAIVTMLAIVRFVQFQGVLQAFSFFINCGLIAIVWWSANKLTWDCTMIDEEAEDSGEGLMEAVGLERPGKAAIEEEIASAAARPGSEPPAEKPRNVPLTWWQKFLDRRKRPHAPGVWVVYFSLATLPLFGIGQFFIPTANQENRQYAFQLLFIYTGSGLALLLSTSFLGLRRYLRQRRQEMPLPIVNLWLGIGAAMIVAAMTLAILLPRSNAEYDLSDLAVRVGSPDQNSSSFGVGQDGVEENQPDAQTQPREGEETGAASDQPADKTDASKTDENGKKESPQSQEGDQNKNEISEKTPAKKTDADKKQAGKSQKDKSDSKKKQPDNATDQSSQDNQSSDKNKSEKKEAKKPPEKKEQPSSISSGGSSEKKEPSKKPQEKKPSSGPRLSPNMPKPSPPHFTPTFTFAWLVTIFKWIFYIAVAIIVIFAFWRNREGLWKAFCDFMQFFIDLWQNIFGSSHRRAEEAVEAAKAGKRLPRFTDFKDPFAARVAGRYPPAELVRYTFAALDAWARDHGFSRHPDQTPHEFVGNLVVAAPALGEEALRLADLYCQVAYTPFALPPTGASQLFQLWQIMRSQSVQAPVHQ